MLPPGLRIPNPACRNAAIPFPEKCQDAFSLYSLTLNCFKFAVCVFQLVEDIGFEPMRIIDACKAPEVDHCSNPPILKSFLSTFLSILWNKALYILFTLLYKIWIRIPIIKFLDKLIPTMLIIEFILLSKKLCFLSNLLFSLKSFKFLINIFLFNMKIWIQNLFMNSLKSLQIHPNSCF